MAKFTVRLGDGIRVRTQVSSHWGQGHSLSLVLPSPCPGSVHRTCTSFSRNPLVNHPCLKTQSFAGESPAPAPTTPLPQASDRLVSRRREREDMGEGGLPSKERCPVLPSEMTDLCAV